LAQAMLAQDFWLLGAHLPLVRLIGDGRRAEQQATW